MWEGNDEETGVVQDQKKKITKLLKAETNYQTISLIYSFLLIQEMGNDIRHVIIFNFAIFNPFYVYGIIHIWKHAGKNILHYVHFAKEMTSSPFFNRFKFHKYSVVLWLYGLCHGAS